MRRNHTNQVAGARAVGAGYRGNMRTKLLRVHRWIGLSLCLLLLVQALTGVAVTFRKELSRIIHPQAFIVEPIGERWSTANLFAAVNAGNPGWHIDMAELPQRADGALWFTLSRGDGEHRYVTADPYRGTLLRSGSLAAWPVELLYTIHDRLAAGETGQIVLRFVAAGLLFIVITGPFVWWPGRTRVRQGLRVSVRSGPNRAIRDLHRVGGLVACGVLSIVAATGFGLVWKDAVRSVAGSMVPVADKPNPKVVFQPGKPLLPADELIATARTFAGGKPASYVSIAGKGRGPVVTVAMKAADSARPNAVDRVWLDGYSGRILGSFEPHKLPVGNQIVDWMLPIHDGQVLGTAGRVISLIAGLALAGFAVSGPWLWYRRRCPAAAGAGKPLATISLVVSDTYEDVPGVRVVELRARRGGKLLRFEAGAHITLHLPGGLVRSYSVCNSPAERNRYLIAVRRTPDSCGGSIEVHKLVSGTSLQVASPRNAFPLNEDAPFSLLLAGGIGITPILSMAGRLHALGRAFELHYTVRNLNEGAFIKSLLSAKFANRVVLHVTSKDGRPEFAAPLKAAPAGAHVYLCGPAGFIDAGIGAATNLGWPPEQIHFERFRPVAIAKVEDRAFRVQLARSSRVLEIPAGRTVLDILAGNGISVPANCGHGICGSCVTPVLSGLPEHRDQILTSKERCESFTPCCSRARSEVLVLDL